MGVYFVCVIVRVASEFFPDFGRNTVIGHFSNECVPQAIKGEVAHITPLTFSDPKQCDLNSSRFHNAHELSRKPSTVNSDSSKTWE